jgi:hypothetical protein
MYKEALLVVAVIFIVVGAILMFTGVDVGAKGLSLAEVLIVIGIIFIVLWAILYAIANIVNRVLVSYRGSPYRW